MVGPKSFQARILHFSHYLVLSCHLGHTHTYETPGLDYHWPTWPGKLMDQLTVSQKGAEPEETIAISGSLNYSLLAASPSSFQWTYLDHCWGLPTETGLFSFWPTGTPSLHVSYLYWRRQFQVVHWSSLAIKLCPPELSTSIPRVTDSNLWGNSSPIFAAI